MSAAAEVLALLAKHEPREMSAVRIGLSASRIRELTAHSKVKALRVRGRRTQRARVYGTIKAAVLALPVAGMVMTKVDAEKISVAARRMGMRVVMRKVAGSAARIVWPAPTSADLSLTCSGL